jgi:hypothetical protein
MRTLLLVLLVLLSSQSLTASPSRLQPEGNAALNRVTIPAKKDIAAKDFWIQAEQHLSAEEKACAVDTRPESLIAKHGSYISRLSAEDKAFCVTSLQAIEILRCEKVTMMYRGQMVLLGSAISAEIANGQGEKLSEAVAGQLISQVQGVRSETLAGIDAVFSDTNCSLLRGFSGYFVKKNLTSNVNQKLDDIVTYIQGTHLVFAP